MSIRKLRSALALAVFSLSFAACGGHGGGQSSFLPQSSSATQYGPMMQPAAVAGANTFDADLLAMKPLAYYKLDETNGRAVKDSSGNGYNLQNHTPASIALGVPGLVPDGGTAYGVTGASSVYGQGATISDAYNTTIVAFVKGTFSTPGFHRIACMPYYNCLAVGNGYAGSIMTTAATGLGGGLDTKYKLTDNQTHMLVFEHNEWYSQQIPNGCLISVDGAPLDSYPNGGCALGRWTNDWEIGHDSYSGYGFPGFDGTIDNVALFWGTTGGNGLLTQAQICQLAVDAGVNTNPKCPGVQTPPPPPSGAPNGNVYVGNTAPINNVNGQITEFSSLALNGPPAGAITNLPNASGQVFTGSALTVDSSGNLWAAENANPYYAVVEYAGTANGNAIPLRTFTPANVFKTFSGIAVDRSGNIYVSDAQKNAIYVYAPTSTGSALPIRTIVGPQTQLASPTKLNFDPNGNLWVNNNGSLLEFSGNATGNAKPIGSMFTAAWVHQCISSTFNSNDLMSFTFDNYGNLIGAFNVQGNPNNMWVMAPGFSPTSCAAKNKFNSEFVFADIAADTNGYIYGTGQAPNTQAAGTMEVYPENASDPAPGTPATPYAKVAGVANGIVDPGSIAVYAGTPLPPPASPAPYVFTTYGSRSCGAGCTNSDSDEFDIWSGTSSGSLNPTYSVISNSIHNPASLISGPGGELLLVNTSVNSFANIMVLPPVSSAYGSALPTPTTEITGTSTLLSWPQAVGVDSSGNIAVLNTNAAYPYVTTGAAILKFASGANGNATPTATIPTETDAVNTGLAFPADIAVAHDGTLYVANRSTNPSAQASGDIAVFAAGAHGDVAPSRTIGGAGTQINYPYSVSLDARGYVYVLTGDNWAAATQSGQNGLPIADTNPRIVVFAPGASTPVAVIQGNLTTLNAPIQLRVDGQGGIYVADYGAKQVDYFAPGSTGNVAPTRSFTNTFAQSGSGFFNLGV